MRTSTTVFVLGACLLLAASCRFDPAYRDFPEIAVASCTDGVIECRGASLVRCVNRTPVTLDDCGAREMACAPLLLKCTPCLPNELTCDGTKVVQCKEDGQARIDVSSCDLDRGFACRRGACIQLCDQAAREKSNVGCEYWPVDLDNTVLPDGIAAAQQYAVIVSNPQPDVPAIVTIEEDVSPVGQPSSVRQVAIATIGVRHLEVFKLGPREVDGSTPEKLNQGTHTALTRNAFRLRSTVPIVAYQFNPLDNVNVKSNDATLLLPTAALNSTGRAYVVGSWPQTLARTSDPETNGDVDLRAFLTLVGTRPDTKVHLKTKARIVPGGPFPSGVPKDGEVDAVLQPFEVLNLETGDFNADFTGSTIDANAPVVVYAGNEASDAPFYTTLAARYCCADHLESQVTPLRAIGKNYVLGRMPNRSRAVQAAGGAVQPFDEVELYRVVGVVDGVTNVKTTLPPPWDSFTLDGVGKNVTISASRDFTLQADKAVLIADVQVSQEAAGISIANGLPGGDPSFLFVPPVEQWRREYVLLTPDKYAFDFLVITAPYGVPVYLDGGLVDGSVCEVAPADGLDEKARGSKTAPYSVYRCQLSYPTITTDVAPNNVLPGKQNDGVHRVVSGQPVGVLVYGFDYRVSYAYAGGTELVDINTN